MGITAGNKTGVTETEAANARRDLVDVLNRWWSQKSSAGSSETVDVAWGSLNFQLILDLDNAKAPQIRSTLPVPRSVRETINSFLSDTCNLTNPDEHFQVVGIKEKVVQTAINIASEQGVDDVGAPLTKFRSLSQSQFGLFRRPVSNNAASVEPDPTKDRSNTPKTTP